MKAHTINEWRQMMKYTWFKKIIGTMVCTLTVAFMSMNALAATSDCLYRYVNQKTEKVGLLNVKGEVVSKTIYSFADNTSEGLTLVGKKGKCGFIDAKGKEVIKAKYISAESFSEGVAVVQEKDGYYGYINKKGKWIIKPMRAEYCSSFHDGLARVCVNGKNGFIKVEF